jgi:hypothetical protein
MRCVSYLDFGKDHRQYKRRATKSNGADQQRSTDIQPIVENRLLDFQTNPHGHQYKEDQQRAFEERQYGYHGIEDALAKDHQQSKDQRKWNDQVLHVNAMLVSMRPSSSAMRQCSTYRVVDRCWLR